jgi:hypothetical protein
MYMHCKQLRHSKHGAAFLCSNARSLRTRADAYKSRSRKVCVFQNVQSAPTDNQPPSKPLSHVGRIGFCAVSADSRESSHRAKLTGLGKPRSLCRPSPTSKENCWDFLATGH